MATAVFLGSGQIFATQAAVSAVLVAMLQPASDGFSGARFVDALIGGGVALLANSLLLPADPVQMVRGAAEPVLDELALTLEAIADAIESGEQEAAERALLRARDLDELEARRSRRRSPSAARPPASRPCAAAIARHGRLLRRGRRPDRPRDPQRPRARPRGACAARGWGRTCRQPVADAIRDLAEAVLERCARRSIDPERADAVRTPALHAAAQRHPRAARRPATSRSPWSSARSARPPSTCCGARA